MGAPGLLNVDTSDPVSPTKSVEETPSSAQSQRFSANWRSPERIRAEEQITEDMGEMGHLNIVLSGLKDLDNKEEALTRVTLGIELVTSDYSKTKAIVVQRDARDPGGWGGGVFFRIFQSAKETQIELKVSRVDDRGGMPVPVECGYLRLNIVPALDFCPRPRWEPLKDPFVQARSAPAPCSPRPPPAGRGTAEEYRAGAHRSRHTGAASGSRE